VIRLIVERQDTRDKEVTFTALDEAIRKTWIEIQRHRDVPVNAIGVQIDPKDVDTLRAWRAAGIDHFVRK